MSIVAFGKKMARSKRKKTLSRANGYSLIELMVVIAIMGILSAMGFAGLHGAVINNRTQDAAVNTAAFLNRVSAEAKRLSSPLIVCKTSDQRIDVYKGTKCSGEGENLQSLLYFQLNAPMKFIASSGCPTLDCDSDEGCDVDWLDGTSGVFRPKIGLSAAPSSGNICSQYASTSNYAVAVKKNTENFIRALTSSGDDDGWD